MKPDVVEDHKLEYEGLTFNVQHVIDDCPDASDLGTFTSKLDDYVIERETGKLYGEMVYEDRTVPVAAYDLAYGLKPTFVLGQSVGSDEDIAWLREHAEHIDFENWDDEHLNVSVHVAYRQVLAEYPRGAFVDRNSYRYVKANDNLPHNPKNWAHVSKKEIAQCYRRNLTKIRLYNITTKNKAEALDILYALEDWRRLEELSRGDWYYLGIEVVLELSGEEVTAESVWGVESDSDAAYFKEVETDLAHTIITNLPNTIQRLRAASARKTAQANRLEQYLKEKVTV